MSAVTEVQSQESSTRRLGKIPVRNLWLLMLYASDLYRHLGTSKVDVEDNPDEIADLVAEILCHQVEERMMRNLSYGYESKVAVISRVRGRIDTLTTERQRLLEKGKVCCRFDELTVDTPRNRYVRAALECLTKLKIKSALARKCRILTLSFERLGVGKIKPVNYSGKSERFGRHDISDQKMIAAADLAFSLSLPTEFDGQFHLTTPDTQKEWLRKLFEKAIAGFYAVVLSGHGWRVEAGKSIGWAIEQKSSGIDKIFPLMRTDITLSHEILCRRIIIDTKFNSIVTKGWYRDETLRSGYIYQIYTYLRSQEGLGDPLADKATGILLHPSIGSMLDESVVIQGHEIRFATIDLSAETKLIRHQLLQIVEVDRES